MQMGELGDGRVREGGRYGPDATVGSSQVWAAQVPRSLWLAEKVYTRSFRLSAPPDRPGRTCALDLGRARVGVAIDDDSSDSWLTPGESSMHATTGRSSTRSAF